MKLAARIIILLVLGVFVLLVIAEYISLRHENERLSADMEADAAKLSDTVSQIFEEIHDANGPARAIQILERINGINDSILVRLVYLDVAEGDRHYPGVPKFLQQSPRAHICSFEHYNDRGEEHLYTYASLYVENRPAAIEIAEPVHHKISNSYYYAIHTVALLGATALLGAALVVAIGGAWIGRPLQRLIEQTRSIGRGELTGRLHLKRKDEFGELAHALNSMCDQLESAQDEIAAETAARDAALNQLRHADRLRTVGRLAAGIAHELGTPLNVVSGRANLIASGRLAEEEIRKSAAAIKSESDRIATIIRQLLDFARRNTPKRSDVDLVALTRQTVELLTPIAEKHGNNLEITCGTSETTVAVDAGQIQQVLTNLIVNAAESMPDGGSVEIGVSRQHANPPEGVDCQPGVYLRVSICDHGEGISPETMEHLFEPFFTTKEIGQGTGLGLSIAYGIIQDHGGWIDVVSELGQRELLLGLSADGGNAMQRRVLIVDDDLGMCEMLAADLQLRGFEPTWTTSPNDALQRLKTDCYHIVLTDLKMPEMSGTQLCERVVANRPDIPVVVMTAFGSLETAQAAIRAGAYDFVTKPVELDLLAMTLERAHRHQLLQEKVKVLSEEVEQLKRFDEILGTSSPMQKLFEQLSRIADTETSVLITGESGTGKELVARAIHRKSRRQDQPFVPVNCAALPDALLESELFGHAKGAFTDAHRPRKGLFLEAEGGTLFLDEIGDFPLATQAKLLRALEEQRLRPVGGDRELPFDVRILSATNRDLETAVEEERFREDLFFRINVIQLEVPPLRARSGDILLLAQHFLELFAARSKKDVTGLSHSVADKLMEYAWPGNVRELRNVIERAVALTGYEQLAVDDLPVKIRDYKGSRVEFSGNDPTELVALEDVERRYILHVLNAVGGNKTLAARTLGLDRKTLYRKLRQFGELDS